MKVKLLGKRGLALFLALVMCMSLLNLTAFAAEVGEFKTCPSCGELTFKLTTKRDATCQHEGLEVWNCQNNHFSFLGRQGCTYAESNRIPQKAHNVPSGTVIEPATCTTSGILLGWCYAECGSRQYVPIAPLGHEYTSEVTTPATCATEGVMTYTCVRGDDSYTEAIPVTNDNHRWKDVDKEDATCTTEGHLPGKVCENCGAKEGMETISTKGHVASTVLSFDSEKHWYACVNCGERLDGTAHTWDEGVITNASCTGAGGKLYTCTVCGATKTENGENALGHKPKMIEKVPATCLTDGFEIYACERCDYTYRKVISAAGYHEFVNKDGKVPTCEEAGYTSYLHCTACGFDKEKTVYPATGHEWGAYESVGDAEHKMTCTKCGNTKTDSHSTEIISGYEARCDTEGRTDGLKCTVCNAVLKEQEPIAKKDHQYGPWSNKEEGMHIHTCKVCGAPDTAPCVYDGDEWTQWTNNAEQGNHKKSCTVCGGIVYQAHETFGVYTNDAKTHTYTVYCKHCDYKVVETADEEHSFNDDHVCSKCGYGCTHEFSSDKLEKDEFVHKYTCEICGYVDTEKHAFDGGTVTVEPACEEKGKKEFACDKCGYTYTEDIDPIGHGYGAWTNDGDDHIRVCANDETHVERAAHTWGAWSGSTNQTRSCAGCGATQSRTVGTPSRPSTPSTPSRPSTPGTPSTPSTPVEPTDPVEPDEPGVDIPDEDPPLADLPDEEPPLADLPDEDPPLADLPDEEPPLADAPTTPSTPTTPSKPGTPGNSGGVTIEDEEVPLADIPQTSDASAIWFYLTFLSGAGLLCLLVLELKKSKEN